MRQYYKKVHHYGRAGYMPVGRVRNLWLNLRRWLGFPKKAERLEK